MEVYNENVYDLLAKPIKNTLHNFLFVFARPTDCFGDLHHTTAVAKTSSQHQSGVMHWALAGWGLGGQTTQHSRVEQEKKKTLTDSIH